MPCHRRTGRNRSMLALVHLATHSAGVMMVATTWGSKHCSSLLRGTEGTSAGPWASMRLQGKEGRAGAGNHMAVYQRGIQVNKFAKTKKPTGGYLYYCMPYLDTATNWLQELLQICTATSSLARRAPHSDEITGATSSSHRQLRRRDELVTATSSPR